MYQPGSVKSFMGIIQASHPLLSIGADVILSWKAQYPHGDITALKSASEHCTEMTIHVMAGLLDRLQIDCALQLCRMGSAKVLVTFQHLRYAVFGASLFPHLRAVPNMVDWPSMWRP